MAPVVLYQSHSSCFFAALGNWFVRTDLWVPCFSYPLARKNNTGKFPSGSDREGEPFAGVPDAACSIGSQGPNDKQLTATTWNPRVSRWKRISPYTPSPPLYCSALIRHRTILMKYSLLPSVVSVFPEQTRKNLKFLSLVVVTEHFFFRCPNIMNFYVSSEDTAIDRFMV